MPRSLILIILIIALTGGAAYAGWSEDVRLTYRGFEMDPQVIARNDTVHVVWEQIAGPKHVSYLRSIDGGNNWSQLRNLEDTNGHYGVRQDISLSGDRIFVGWEDVIRSDFVSDLGFTFSVGGSDWHPPGYVFGHHVSMYEPGIANFEDSIYVVYHSREHDSTGNNPLRFIYSGDMGVSWSEEMTVGHVSEYTNFLHVAHCGNGIYVVWASNLPPLGFYREVVATISHDGGQSWSNAMQLSSPDTAAAQLTCIACDEESGNFAVGWMDYGLSRGFPGDLYVRITTDGGYTWRPESHATNHHGVSMSSLAIAADTVWAVWSDRDPSHGQFNDEICFSRSTDLGASWTPYERLTYNPEHSWAPGIAYDNGKLHVVWYNDNPSPDSGMDIYYKRYDPEPSAIYGDAGESLTGRIGLNAYPNPFNSNTIISFSNLKGGEIGVYDIQGRLIRAFQVEGGNNGKIKWDATDASGKKVYSGIYFARARTSQSSQVVKLIYLK